MKRFLWRSFVLLGLYAAMLLACVGIMGILSLMFPISNWGMGGVAVWFVACFGSLCIPDEVWDRFLWKKK